MKSGQSKKVVPLGALALALFVFIPATGITGSFNALTSRIANSIDRSKPSFAQASEAKKLQVRQGLGNLPLNFIQNQGQMDSKVSHYLQGSNTSIYFSSEGLTYALTEKPDLARGALAEKEAMAAVTEGREPKLTTPQPLSRHIMKLDFVGANQVNAVALNQTKATANYFKGAPDQWKTGVPTSTKLVYSNLWPGIDLVYSGTGQKLKYDFHVAPGADPSKIKLAYRGADSVSLNPQGQLTIQTPKGPLTDDSPFSYQVIDGKRVTVKSAYALSEASNGSSPYGFSMGEYDRTKPLVIDPAVLVYSGFIGGSGGENHTRGLAVDSTGAAYVVGHTGSTEATFPDTVGPDLTLQNDPDSFIAKITPDGTGFVYVGYIGGAGYETALSVEVDSVGAAYVAGHTNSNQDTFPVLVGPKLTRDSTNIGTTYVAKVKADGTGLLYCGYIGGQGFTDFGVGIAVDSAGAAYVGGVINEQTGSIFPKIVGPRPTFNCTGYCGFVSKVMPDGSGLVYSSFITSGMAFDIDVDAAGAAYIVGTTSTFTNFPFKIGPDLSSNGGADIWIAKVKPDGSDFDYAGLIGGSGAESGRPSVRVDTTGAAYVVGTTASTHTTFPDKVGPDRFYNGGSTDAFIVKVKADGADVVYGSYVGGFGADSGAGVAVDSSGAYVVGNTNSTETTFPVKDGPDLTQNGGFDTFITKIKPSFTGLVFSSFLGGSASEGNNGAYAAAATDKVGGVYVTGLTSSTESTFPALVGPDLDQNGGMDAFVTKISSPFAPKRPPADFDGNGSTNVSLYRNGVWYVKDQLETSWGGDPTDKAVPGYYNNDATADVAVYRGSTGVWYVKDQMEAQWGGDPSDIPVPGDYNGDGITDLAVYRKSTATWWVKDQFAVQFGGDPSDIPVPADYDGDRITDIAVWRKATGTWYVKDVLQDQWGGDAADVPVPGDYNNDGATDLAVYRNGTWYIKDQANIEWGGDSSDVPVPGDYNSNGSSDIAVYRKATGYWYIKDQFETSWGGDPADKALPLPSSIRD